MGKASVGKSDLHEEQSKLIVLSETNNLDYLRKHGIYPSQFFTDMQMFEKMSSFFRNVKLCCILTGSCSFSRRKLNEMFTFVQERIDDEESNSIKELLIFSDTDVFDREYYRYTNSLGSVNLMKGKRTLKEGINPWKTFEYQPSKETVEFLRAEHVGNIGTSLERYKEHVNTKKTEIEGVIQRPKIG